MNDLFDAATVVLVIVGVVALAHALVGIADRAGWLDDRPLPWESYDPPSHVRVLDPGRCPGALEGSGSYAASDLVVEAQGNARSGDHGASGHRPRGRRP